MRRNALHPDMSQRPSPRSAEFNDWLLACRVIRIIGPWSSIPLLFTVSVGIQTHTLINTLN